MCCLYISGVSERLSGDYKNQKCKHKLKLLPFIYLKIYQIAKRMS